MRLLLALLVVLSSMGVAQSHDDAIEVKLEPCDRLFVVPVVIDGKAHTFLLDTGATSILDLKTFKARGSDKAVDLTAWGGRKNVGGRMIPVDSLKFAGRELRGLLLSAIDLSAMDSACGRKIEGVLGADVLERLGALIDMNARVAKTAVRPVELFESEKREFLDCAESFNRGDPAHMIKHMDTDVVWFTPFDEVRGRDKVLQFLHDDFWSKGAQLTLTRLEPRDLHVAGDSYWLSYEYRVDFPDSRSYRARGTVFSHRKDGEWMISTVHNSLLPVEQTMANKK